MSKGETENTLVQGAMLALRKICERDNIPERIRTAMSFKVDTSYDISQMAFVVRIAWRDPDDGSLTRACQLRFEDDAVRQSKTDLAGELMEMIDSINLRGELFFMKLHKHFPNRVEKVLCDRSGRVKVIFKNGRELTTSEQDLDSVEFLATCGMVYDL